MTLCPETEGTVRQRVLATLALAHGTLRLPAFLPDATLGVVRGVDAEGLERAGVEALVMNAYHLMQKPGSSTIQALGGLHKMSGWPHPILTDSGGFQAYSLVRQNPKWGRISDQGIRFRPEGGEREFLLTPEKSVQQQVAYGADIVVCLDDCTHPADSEAEQETSVTRTIRWARRCKEEFDRLLAQKEGKPRRRMAAAFPPAEDNGRQAQPPLLFGVVQGGASEALRRRCADALLEIGFDGYGYGGWPLDSGGNLLIEMLALTRELIPCAFPLHALGVGQPENVVACARLGYPMFDSALPTRDARSGRLYVFTADPNANAFRLTGEWRDTLYIDDEKHIKADRPLSPGCDCPVCTRYSIGYLRHLHKCGDTLYIRLATLHNLHFMMQLMRLLRKEQQSETDS